MGRAAGRIGSGLSRVSENAPSTTLVKRIPSPAPPPKTAPEQVFPISLGFGTFLVFRHERFEPHDDSSTISG